jgi:hypothetical protein
LDQCIFTARSHFSTWHDKADAAYINDGGLPRAQARQLFVLLTGLERITAEVLLDMRPAAYFFCWSSSAIGKS